MMSLFIRVSSVCSHRMFLQSRYDSIGILSPVSASNSTLTATLALWTLVATLACPPETQARPQGLAGRRTEIAVRTLPNVYLPGPTVKVEVTSLRPVSPRVPELLQQKIQDTLVKNDPKLGPTTGIPATLVACTIMDLGYSTGAEARTRQEYQKTGERTVTDSATGMSRSEDEYGYASVGYTALVIGVRLSVKCEVTDTSTGIVLFNDTFEPVYSDAIDASAGSRIDNLNDVYLRLAGSAADLILAQLSPRVYLEVVELPSGKLKEAGKLLEANSWNEALNLLAATPPFKDQKDEAYRLYAIGIAHEALAYSASNAPEKTLHLGQALDNYRRATELKPREDAFWTTKNRTEALFSQATGLAAQVDALNEARKSGSTAAESGKPDLFHQTRERLKPARIALTNDDVVALVKAGRSTDYITATIKHAPETKFDLSAGELLKIRREGVSDTVVKAMRDALWGPRYHLLRGRDLGFIMAALLVPIALALPFTLGH